MGYVSVCQNRPFRIDIKARGSVDEDNRRLSLSNVFCDLPDVGLVRERGLKSSVDFAEVVRIEQSLAELSSRLFREA